MSPEETAEHLRTMHGWDEEMLGKRDPRDLKHLHIGLHESAAEFPWAAQPRHSHEASPPHSSSRRLAHESDSDTTLTHCPWCGSGNVAATPDGSVMCEFCDRTFTVSLQPMLPNVPQVPGQENIANPAPEDGQVSPESGMAEADPNTPVPTAADNTAPMAPAGPPMPPGAPAGPPASSGPPAPTDPAAADSAPFQTAAGARLGEAAYVDYLARLHTALLETAGGSR